MSLVLPSKRLLLMLPWYNFSIGWRSFKQMSYKSQNFGMLSTLHSVLQTKEAVLCSTRSACHNNLKCHTDLPTQKVPGPPKGSDPASLHMKKQSRATTASSRRADRAVIKITWWVTSIMTSPYIPPSLSNPARVKTEHQHRLFSLTSGSILKMGLGVEALTKLDFQRQQRTIQPLLVYGPAKEQLAPI